MIGSRLASIGNAIAWFAVVLVISFGGAGLVAAMDHVAAIDQVEGGPIRPGPPTNGDAEVTPLLDAAQTDLEALAERVDSLGVQARGALATLTGSNPAAGQVAIAQGDVIVADVVARTAALRQRLDAVPYVRARDAALKLSVEVVDRHETLVDALGATDGLKEAWVSLTTGAAAATRMSRLLAEHDRLVGKAADRGVRARYTDAIAFLDQAKTQLDAARSLRDVLSGTVDVTTLDQWLDRNSDYDAALRGLYQAISKVGKTVTEDTRQAVKAEAAARARLPADGRGLVVIMAEIGRGGMNQAIIEIEHTRTLLADAIEAATPEAATPSPNP